MHEPSTPFRQILRTHASLIPIVILALVGVTHRAILLTTLWPTLSEVIKATAWAYQAMQLLPREVLIEHPWYGLLYLQMTPPIPNLIYTLLVQIPDLQVRIASLLALQGAIGITTSILLALLITRMGASVLTATLAGLVYLLWGDVLLMEYAAIGFFFHETLTMLLCCAACLAALSTLRNQSRSAAATLGICIALLALTRATFSYFAMVLPVWFAVTGLWRQRQLLLATAIPLIVLQGGWVLKNNVIHGHFSLSTSTWGGANLLHGELARDPHTFPRWLAVQKPLCDEPWHQMSLHHETFLRFFPDFDKATNVPIAVAETDQNIAKLRGRYVNHDTHAAQKYSQCLQREFLHFWLQNPQHALQGFWRSYGNFWLPIRNFINIAPIPLTTKVRNYPDDGLHFINAIGDGVREYETQFLLPERIIFAKSFDASNFRRVSLFVIPGLGSVMSATSAVMFHAVPLMLALSWWLRRKEDVDGAIAFPLLVIVYVAALTSVVEYSENMRFRLAVEPLLWVMSIICGQRWLSLLRTAMHRRTATAA